MNYHDFFMWLSGFIIGISIRQKLFRDFGKNISGNKSDNKLPVPNPKTPKGSKNFGE